MTFHEVRFPDDIAYGATGGPEFATSVVATASGYEQRNINWSSARGRWDVTSGLKKQTQLDTLIAFFRARKGRAYRRVVIQSSSSLPSDVQHGPSIPASSAAPLVHCAVKRGAARWRISPRPASPSSIVQSGFMRRFSLSFTPGAYGLPCTAGEWH